MRTIDRKECKAARLALQRAASGLKALETNSGPGYWQRERLYGARACIEAALARLKDVERVEV